MRIASILILSALAFGSPATASEHRLSGAATAVDGDTLDFSGTRVRLLGIDAPEAKQSCKRGEQSWSCGTDARDTMAGLIAGQTVECHASETDVYGRLLATCYRDELDLGLAMIESGMAVTRDNSPERYVAAEALRKTHRVGIWSGTFQAPAEWRAANPAQLPTPAKVSQRLQRPASERAYRNSFGCAIKGNRNKRGEWIYHLPGRPYYDQTRPEQLFCTEAEAQRAGYRRSKA